MNKVLALVAALSISAMATPILSGSEQSLQSILDTRGNTIVDVNRDQVVFDQYWEPASSDLATATMIIEIAGNANSNCIGIYDPNTNAELLVFRGDEVAGDYATIKFNTNYNRATVSVWDGTEDTIKVTFQSAIGTFKSDRFGFYIEGNNYKYYSDESKNDNDKDYMVAFKGTGEDVDWNLDGNFSPWLPEEYVLAWEDGTDDDFNDLVMLVQSVSPVPEPATLGFIGLSLLSLSGLSFIRRKK